MSGASSGAMSLEIACHDRRDDETRVILLWHMCPAVSVELSPGGSNF